MIVRCIATRVPADQIPLSTGVRPRDRRANVTLGRRYLVLGLTLAAGAVLECLAPMVLIADDSAHVVELLLSLFAIVDPRLSRYWTARSHEDGSLTLWPPSFYRKYYIDDLLEGVPEVVDDFRRVRGELEAEWPQLLDPSVTAGDRAVLTSFLSAYWPSGKPIDDAGDAAAIAAFVTTESPETRDRVSAAIVRFLDAPEPESAKAEFIRATAWRYLPGDTGRPIEWLAGVLQKIQRHAEGT